MGHELQPAIAKRRILIASAPNDPQARQLVTELRSQGFHIVIAETVVLAALADEVAVCVVVLHPVIWRTTPSITTAIRSKPSYLIPVLAEPMELPIGQWSTDPITFSDSVPQTASELAERITTYLRTLPDEPTTQATSQEPSTDPRMASLEPFVLPRPKRRSILFQPRNRSRLQGTFFLIIAILLLAGGVLAVSLLHSAPNVIVTLPPATTGSVGNTLPYSAVVPGPGCDTQNAQWQVGDHYRTPVTPTTTGKPGATSTSSSSTTTQASPQPTTQLVLDKSTVAACETNGLLVTHNAHFDAYATIIFLGNGQVFPHHFSTQVTATIVSATNSASVDLGVRSQDAQTNSSYDSGYGDNTLDVEVNGHWQALRYNDITDNIDAYLRQGFVRPANTFTLAATVNGPVMTFSIDGVQVTTVTDTTYPNSYGISFGISDPDAKKPPSALFSNFSYTPLPDTTLTTNAAVATATAQVAATAQHPYTASIPGFGCDKGGGQWEPDGYYATAKCLSNGLQITQNSPAKFIGSVSFYWLGSGFPANYSVKAQIDESRLNGGCAGFTTRTDTQSAGYLFLVCTDGYWQIERFDSNGGNGHQLAQGNTTQRSSYTMVVTSKGTRESLSLNGVQVASVVDKSLTTTDHIELSISAQPGASGSAIYSNFAFTPLP